MTAITREIQQNMTPEEALNRLMEGNERFVSGKKISGEELNHQVSETASAQYPFAAVLGCIDSRTASEHLFDQGIGDIFNVRVAGNIVNEDILGSLEFACKVVGSKLILVMGHTACGAVTSAGDRLKMGNITHLLAHIQPAVRSVENPKSNIDKVAEKNVLLSVDQIRKNSPILAEMENNGEIMIKSAMYDVSSGKVTLVDQN
ncbi:MAG: carbonic anhydrase [Bacteroidales bacterium]|nr:carbonic anhydrase [Bacteroidales bacterium]